MTSSDDDESKDDDPTVDDQDEDEDEDEDEEDEDEDEDENANDEQDSRGSSSDEESSSDDDDESKEEGKVAAATTEDGHQLSAYELQRLERIRRNKEYLASLGLEKNKPRPQKPQPARKKRDSVKLARRSSLSRTTKAKPISYSENPTPRWQKAMSGDASATQSVTSETPPQRKKKQPRMERFIYDEFKRIEADVKRSFKIAKRNMREADIAYRYASKEAERYERKQKRELEYKRSLEELERERNVLGCTAKEMLQEVDSRIHEIQSALHAFDHRFHQQANLARWAEQQEENARKMEILDAMDRFPRALKDAVQDLDLLLLERSPRDPPPPRRGSRKRDSSTVTVDEPEPDAKKRSVDSSDLSKGILADGSWGSLAAAITAENLSSSAQVRPETSSPVAALSESDSQSAMLEKPKKKKREVIPKNVGGWVSPGFAKDVDRSWLESDSPPKKFDAARYIPQIGDTIVYYPAGHRAFLKVHPDILGKKTRNITRMTLWERAKKEKAKLGKAASEEVASEGAEKKQAPPESVDKALTWWNEEWLSAVEEDLGRYPIICRVEKTHVEFPPDPYAESKIITKDDQSGGVQVTWALPKDTQKKKQSNPPLCLAVMLRPLTPVLPSRSGAAEAASDQQLTLAPNFYVVTFPCKVSPFILPFSWAYRSTYSLSTGLPIRLASKPEWRGKVKNFRSLDGEYDSGRLEDKIDSVRVLWKALKTGANSFAKSLEGALSSDTLASIPITDACTVIERMEVLLDLHCAEASDSNSLSATNGSISMMDLIRSTLPLWKEVIVENGMGKKLATSAWELMPIEAKMNARSGPLSSLSADVETETGLVYIIDEPLRAKFEFTIEGFLKDTPDSSIFRPLVSDEEAPSYSCAVPRGMAFDKILRRLKARKQTSDGISRCYYRSVDSLLGDISAVADNCLLYNSPDSYVVEQAMEIVPVLKRLVTQVASSHFKEKEAREKSVEERRQAILLQVNAPALIEGENDLNDSTSRSRGAAKRKALQAPFTEPLYRSWIQDVQPDGSWKRTCDPSTSGARSTPSLRSESSAEHTGSSETLQVGGWVPQSGDTILYSRALHSDFVKGHHPSLLTEQCTLPRFVGEGDSMKQSSVPDENAAAEMTASSDSVQNHWLVGKVVWVRASFPRAPSKRDTDYENTFGVASPILALGIRFNYSWASNKIHTVYWRPCVFGEDSTVSDKSASSTRSQHPIHKSQNSAGDDESRKTAACKKCAACLLRVDQSFVRPAWVPIVDPDSPGNENSQTTPYLMPDGPLPSENMFAHPNGLSDEAISSIDRCLNMLKRRCLASIPPDYIDPKFSKESVKKGWTPAAKPGKKLPTFERLIGKGNFSWNEGATRGIEKVDMNSVALLANSHYLPPWTSSLSEGSAEKTNRDGIAQSLSPHETLSPNPNLCLELIQHRLRNGYYRDRSALAHDIEEAYVSSVLLILSKPAAAKKGKSVSIRRIAKVLSSQEILSSPRASDKKITKISALSEDEKIWVDKINRVRMLYGTALVCATEAECMERMFGTAPNKKTVAAKVNESMDERQQIFNEARNRLGFIFAALQRDPCTNRASQPSINPIIRVKVRFSGQEASPKDLELHDENRPGSLDVMDTTKPRFFEHRDYEDNEALVKLFFGHPGRMASCGRCRAYGRSVIACRLYRRHSLPDFDWNEVFRGTGGIDGLLYMLRTGLPAVVPRTSSSQPPALLNGNTGIEDAEGPNDDSNKPNAATIFEKAKVAMTLAKSLLEQARRKVQAPIRLSEEFIRSYFPVDESDGHYNYCTICGLSGDVVCCEGCPNVAHPHCVKLSDIPEDDWYCSRCTLRSNDMVVKSATESGVEKEDHETIAESQKPPAMSKSTAASDQMLALSASATDDAENDDISRLEDILNELKSLRPRKPSKQRTASERKEGVIDDEDDDVEEDDNEHASTRSVTIEIGTKVRKSFGIYGEYIGTVYELPTSDRPFYRVRYEDGDEEDMEEDELRCCLEQDERRRSSLRGTRKGGDEPEPDNMAKKRRGRKEGTGNIEEPAPVPKRGRGRPPKRQAVEVEEPVSAARRERGPPMKRQTIEIEEPGRHKRKPRTCQVENCPDPDNCPGRSHRDCCWSYRDATDQVAKRRGTPQTGKKRKTRTCKVENCPDPKSCPGKSHRGSCWSFKEKDTIPNERDPLDESPPKKGGLSPPEESPPKKRGVKPRR